MARKYELITDLYRHKLQNMSDNHSNWTAFLKSACCNYKCSFDEQVLIYAQRPNATAVLEIEKWNKQFGRWVNKGATGIAVFDREYKSSNRLKYYFDVSDTHESRFSRPFKLWNVQNENQGEIIEALENSFGALENRNDLPLAILSASRNAASDNLTDYLTELLKCKESSFLEELSDDAIKVYFQRILENSICYMLLTRCGYNADSYIGFEEFIEIINFNTVETMNTLGTATSDIAEMGLREIALTLHNLQKTKLGEIRTFAEKEVSPYNEIINQNIYERTDKNDLDLHTEGGLLSPQPDYTEDTASRATILRTAPSQILEGTSQGDVYKSLDDRQADRTPIGDSENGYFEDGATNFTDGEGARRDGTAQSKRPDEMGGTYEQYKELSPGDSDDTADIQLETLPTQYEQIKFIQEAEEINKSSAFLISGEIGHFTQEEIDLVLQDGSGIVHGKYRIYELYQRGLSLSENARFLSDEYGWGGKYPAVSELKLNEDHNAKGITISRGGIMEPEAKIILPWNKVSKRIGELILSDRYLNPKEKEQYPHYKEEENARAERGLISSEFLSLIRDYNDFQTQIKNTGNCLNLYVLSDCSSCFQMGEVKTYRSISRGEATLPLMQKALNSIIDENTHLTERAEEIVVKLSGAIADKFKVKDISEIEEPAKEYKLSLGDKLYLGASEYELLAYGENEVHLFDSTFPLINKIMQMDEFDKKLKENPCNDHLLKDHKPLSFWEQLQEIKVKQNEDTVILFEVGDFFESYGDDANLISETLDISLINKTIDGDIYSMCGFPIFTLEKNVEQLNNKGFDVALAAKENKLFKVYKVLPYHKEEKTPVLEIDDELPSPSWNKPKTKESSYALHPEISKESRNNFQIIENADVVISAKDKASTNIKAIILLKQLESENRFATSAEQEVLSKYIGWGGLSEVFDQNKTAWSSEYLKLKELLDETEYSAARESTLTAFYTSPVIIRAMYRALSNMGFTQGNILEPSCGIGSFFGLIPQDMGSSKLYGVELDSITGRIAKQLYQNANIAVSGFENTNLPDSFFDVAIGNVPFGQFKVSDKRYDKHKWLIHDYFFGKTLDKVRPGGVIAFITSKGTMDKENPEVRKYIAQRAELLGAIRLPNNAFKASAGTQVTADIIFLQKRDRIVDIEPDWVHLGKDDNGIVMNSYFAENPDMIMGEMVMQSSQFGMDSTCKPYDDIKLDEILNNSVESIHAEITENELFDLTEETDNSIPADPFVRNFSYTLVDNKIYFRENSKMYPPEVSVTAENRIKGMINMRDCVRSLIEYQTEDYSDNEIKEQQVKLNRIYDEFVKNYGLINSRANSTAFAEDSSYCLLCSLEILDENAELLRKADMFSKRTIKQKSTITSVGTASEALAVCIAEKAKVDINFMCSLTGKSEDEIYEDLNGVIFLNPQSEANEHSQSKYLTADDYLSGNVREKLILAKKYAQINPQEYSVNVAALQAVQPLDLTASEISVRLGATWLPAEIVQAFIFELFSTPRYHQWDMKVHYSQHTGEWNIEGKSRDRDNIKVYSAFGTARINGYKIIEETLNLKDVRIYDYILDAEGKKQQVLNKKETAIAQGKQELIKAQFSEWIWADPERRELLCKLYNEKFNSQRPREYDGSHIHFSGMNPEISLRPHQVNAIAHILYGGNTLLAHVVGAGKTFEMVAAAQEGKRLGLCQKSLFVVPNHLTEQWACEYLQLYPSANILVATKKDFETKNRKKFCGRISTGDYDAIIIGHSQFEKIPMSIERQHRILQEQLDDVITGLDELKRNRGENFSIKQLEKTKKSIKLKLDKLNDQGRKDDVVTFEELGVDRVFIDEAHYYKNLFLFTKMRE